MAIKTLSIADFTGGRNSKASSPMLAKNESLDQYNTWCENGALSKKRGYTAVNSQIDGTHANYIIKMIQTNLGASGANRLIMMGRLFSSSSYSARLVYTDNGTTFIACEATPTVLSGASVPFIGMFAGYLYVSDGVNTVIRYDGTTVTTVAAFPKQAKCAVHKNYIFTIKGKTLSWSDVSDPTTWPANNFQTINSDLGDIGIALKPWGGNLVIFMRHSMWILVGDSFDPIDAQYYLQKIDVPSNFNFLFSQTIVTHQGVLKFLTADGFYAYTGGTQIIKISDPIQPDIDTLISTAVYTTSTDLEIPEYSPKSFVWKNMMYCSGIITTDVNTRRMIIQDEKGKWWWGGDTDCQLGPIEAVSANLGSGEKLYGGLPGYPLFFTLDTGYTNTNSTTLAATVAINGYWISKDFNLPNESRFLYADIFLKKQTAVATLGTLVFSYSIDGATFITANVDMMNGVGTILKKRVPIMRIGRAIRVKVLNAELGVTYEVYTINVAYEPTDAMR